jgi:hypothetical protein
MVLQEFLLVVVQVDKGADLGKPPGIGAAERHPSDGSQ